MARTPLPPEVEQLFAAGGSMGALMRDIDWDATPVGAPARWPQSLRTAVSICLESRFPLLIWWGADLVKIYNDAYAAIIGNKHPKAMGQRGEECWPEIWDTIGPMLSGVLAGRGATYSEDQMLPLVRHGFAEECYFTFSYSPIRDESGGVGGVFTAVTETTGRVIGARRLAVLRTLAQRMMGTTSPEQVLADAVSVLDAAPSDVPLAVAYLLTDDGPRTVSVAGDLREHDLLAVEQGVDPVLAEPGRDGACVRVSRPLGPHSVTELMVLPIEAGGVTARLVLGVSRALRLDDDYLSFLRLAAGQVSTALAEALGYQAERARAEALAALDKAKTAFFANISHEFRTPLTLMLGPTEDALSDTVEPLGTRQRHRAELVRRNALRLLKLVNTLLDFSRLESGRATALYEPVDLADYTAELAGLFRSAVEGAGLRFVVDCPPVSEPVFVDREMWEKIVLNLLSNALKFTFDGSITVRLRQGADEVTLCVTDTGIGIEPDDQPALFERFHRLQATQSRTFEGSGIGLALVAELAGLHGGSVSVDSAPRQGSTFSVTLPLGAGHLPPDQVVEEGSRPGLTSSHTAGLMSEALRWLDDPDRELSSADDTEGSRPRVLVVDDNADMRDYVTAVLGDEYVVQHAADGAAALDRVRTDLPDLVLADVMMPRLDGFGLLAALRADPETAHVPVIMLSARAGDDAAVEGLDAGADDYLTKPFAARELIARVRAALTLESMRRERGRDRELLAELETSRAMLAQAQRLAGVGSWKLELKTGAVTASEELVRQVEISHDELATGGLEAVLTQRVHPDDVERVRKALKAGAEGQPVDYEVRVVTSSGEVRTFRTMGVVERDADGRPVRLVGSNQDITEQRQVEAARAAETAAREAAERERRIADTLQHSLLPSDHHVPYQLDVASFYRAGTEGTQVGGDWYDVIELSADRTGLVIGDVMGRGVQAAAVMGQLRAAIRAYARLDLPPADLLELLDGVVRDFGDDQIVTCIYAVYDPADSTLTYANAGHLPPMLVGNGGGVVALTGSAAPPLGTGLVAPAEDSVELDPGATVTLYTDGLVERRDRDIDVGLERLGRALGRTLEEDFAGLPARLSDVLGIGTADDDVALLIFRVRPDGGPDDVVACDVGSTADAVAHAREVAREALDGWSLSRLQLENAVLLVSELVTNAVVHGRPPIGMRIRRTTAALVIEVSDGAAFLPRLMRPLPEDEHGRGLQLVDVLADRWGSRPTAAGKATWCLFELDRAARPPVGVASG